MTTEDQSSGLTRARHRGRRLRQDRGNEILVLGIISWVSVCFVFGIFAWVMGTRDLREIEEGRRDARGRGRTQAGRILGMIHVIVTCVALVIALVLLLLLVTADWSNH